MLAIILDTHRDALQFLEKLAVMNKFYFRDKENFLFHGFTR